MPRFDGTGPMGKGPMTGGGFGWCAERSQGEFVAARRFGRGFGGRGQRLRQRLCWSDSPFVYGVPQGESMMADRDVDFLRSKIESLENSIGEIKKHLEGSE